MTQAEAERGWRAFDVRLDEQTGVATVTLTGTAAGNTATARLASGTGSTIGSGCLSLAPTVCPLGAGGGLEPVGFTES